MKCTSCNKRPGMSVKYPYCNPCTVRSYRKQPVTPPKQNVEGLEKQRGTASPPNKTKPLEKAGESENNNMGRTGTSNKPPVTINSVERYEVGMNARLDAIRNESDVIWIVQGNIGRRPVLADTEQAARERYQSFKNPLRDE